MTATGLPALELTHSFYTSLTDLAMPALPPCHHSPALPCLAAVKDFDDRQVFRARDNGAYLHEYNIETTRRWGAIISSALPAYCTPSCLLYQ
jgi:hypothetical protein